MISNAERHDEGQSILGLHECAVFSRPFHPVARWQRHALGKATLCFGYGGAQVAPRTLYFSGTKRWLFSR
jgi:hypothetical protein